LLEINGMKFPQDRRYYTKHGAHMWLKSEEGTMKIGMDAFLAGYAGFLTFLTVNKEQVKSGETIGSFESAKFVSRLYSPISGRIVAVNDDVLNNPRKINENPYDSWIVEIEADPVEKSGESEYMLKNSNEIIEWITEEIKKVEEDE